MQSNRIQDIAGVMQSVALVLGVGFAVYEFVLKDRQQERQVVQFTLQQTAKLRDADVIAAQQRLRHWYDEAQTNQIDGETNPDTRWAVFEALDTETEALQHFYRVIAACVATGHCDGPLAYNIVCDNAERDHELLKELTWRVGNRWIGTGDFGGLEKIVGVCAGSLIATAY